jgi:hypothetical protein
VSTYFLLAGAYSSFVLSGSSVMTLEYNQFHLRGTNCYPFYFAPGPLTMSGTSDFYVRHSIWNMTCDYSRSITFASSTTPDTLSGGSSIRIENITGTVNVSTAQTNLVYRDTRNLFLSGGSMFVVQDCDLNYRGVDVFFFNFATASVFLNTSSQLIFRRMRAVGNLRGVTGSPIGAFFAQQLSTTVLSGGASLGFDSINATLNGVDNVGLPTANLHFIWFTGLFVKDCPVLLSESSVFLVTSSTSWMNGWQYSAGIAFDAWARLSLTGYSQFLFLNSTITVINTQATGGWVGGVHFDPLSRLTLEDNSVFLLQGNNWTIQAPTQAAGIHIQRTMVSVNRSTFIVNDTWRDHHRDYWVLRRLLVCHRRYGSADKPNPP